MATQNQDKGTGAIAGGGALTAYGAANAPILRAGNKDMSRMVGASPKKQGTRYQAELHRAMQAGKVETNSPVNVLRTPSGRHINAGGTHRHIARQAMGKPSQYNVKDISHEMHISPAQKVTSRLKLAGLQRGSKRAEAGKNVKPVGTAARKMNLDLARRADVADDALWKNPSALKGPVKLARGAGLAGAGIIAGAGALTAGVGLHDRREWKKTHPVNKSAFGVEHEVSKGRLMSDAEIRHRKKVQGHVSQAVGGLGLAALGGTMAASPVGRNALRKIPKLKNRVAPPPAKKPDRDKIQGAVQPILATSAGLGGLGSFNFASYTGAESRKRTMAPKPVIKKSDEEPLEMGFYGEEGQPLTHQEIEAEIEKAWTPSAGNFDSEASRAKRAKGYESASLVGAGAGAASAGHYGAKVVRGAKKVKPQKMAPFGAKGAPMGSKATTALPIGELKALKKPAGKLGAALAVTGVAGAAHHHLKRKQKGDWSPYAKRDTTSAFGVDHRVDSQ